MIHIDSFGNLVTNIDETFLGASKVESRKGLVVSVAGTSIKSLRRSYSEAAQGSLLAIIGSFGYLEIAANQASARNVLNAGIGTRVTVVLPSVFQE